MLAPLSPTGSRMIVSVNALIIPKAANIPRCRMRGMSLTTSDAKPAAVVRAVSKQGTPALENVSIIASSGEDDLDSSSR